MEAKKGYSAKARYMHMAASKVRPIADHVRRVPYPQAVAILESLPHKSAKLLIKVVKSAASNALYENKKLDEEMLYVKELFVNEGPQAKRVWARGRGRADRLIKRSCHIVVVVDEIQGMGA
jgi:large subunit ribosomal protein L22